MFYLNLIPQVPNFSSSPIAVWRCLTSYVLRVNWPCWVKSLNSTERKTKLRLDSLVVQLKCWMYSKKHVFGTDKTSFAKLHYHSHLKTTRWSKIKPNCPSICTFISSHLSVLLFFLFKLNFFELKHSLHLHFFSKMSTFKSCSLFCHFIYSQFLV